MISTGNDIIKKFELWTDDQTELSTDEELFLANEKQREILNETVWEFLRKEATGSFTGGEINLATVAPDFKHLMANYSEDTTYQTPTETVVWVGGAPIRVIPMAMRTQHQNQNVCWVDLVANKIKFANTSIGGTFIFDYQYSPDDFTATTAPAIPKDHRLVIVYAMLIDDDIIQKTEKGRSNIKENSAQYGRLLSNLKSYNAKFMLS